MEFGSVNLLELAQLEVAVELSWSLAQLETEYRYRRWKKSLARLETEISADGKRVLHSWRMSLALLETEFNAVGDRVKGSWRQSSEQLEKEFSAARDRD